MPFTLTSRIGLAFDTPRPSRDPRTSRRVIVAAGPESAGRAHHKGNLIFWGHGAGSAPWSTQKWLKTAKIGFSLVVCKILVETPYRG